MAKRSGTVKRNRRSKEEITQFRQALIDFCEEHHPLSVRHLYYLASQAQLVTKDDKGYRLVKDDSGILREQFLATGRGIPFEWLKDESRQVIQIYTCEDVNAAIIDTADQYRRNIWTDQPNYVELWCEAKASISALTPLVHQWHLRLVPAGGFSSKTYVYDCAQFLAGIEKPIHIVYVGDFDPSGLGIEKDIQTRLQRYSPGLEFELHRIALTEQQVHDWDLPRRPPKELDSRIKSFPGDRVAELEVIPPSQLRQMCSDAIEALIDPDILLSTKDAEAEDLSYLQGLADR